MKKAKCGVETSRNDDAIPLSKEQLAEMDRRMREHDADPSTAIPWAEVSKRLWAKVE